MVPRAPELQELSTLDLSEITDDGDYGSRAPGGSFGVWVF